MPHPIEKFIEKAEISNAEFARRADISPQFIGEIIAGTYYPKRANALKIVEAADHTFTIDDLLRWEPN